MIPKRDFFYLQVHFELEQRFSRLILAGYMTQNSLDSGPWSEPQVTLNLIGSDVIFSSTQRVPTHGCTIMGISGIGKWRII